MALPRKGSIGGNVWSVQLWFDWDYLRCPPGKVSEAFRLSAEPTETSEKPLPPGFPEAEALPVDTQLENIIRDENSPAK